MATLTIEQIIGVWLGAGGPASVMNTAAAFAMAESGGQTDAISFRSDIGLWQINSSWTPTLHVSWQQLRDPHINASAAVRISHDGSNWGDWCTAYPGGRCPKTLQALTEPLPGSPAAGWLATVEQSWHVTPTTIPSDPAPAGSDVPSAWSQFQTAMGTEVDRLINQFNAVRNIIGGIPL